MSSKWTEEASYTLLTNIHFFQRSGDNLRINCRAILITEDGNGILAPSYTIRGFGTEAAWDVFSMCLDKDTQLPYELQTAEDRSTLFLSHDGTTKTIFSGNTLTLKDGTQFFLQADDSSRPIDVYKEIGDICKVWEVLFDKTAEYWMKETYMPRLQWGPPSMGFNHYKAMR